MSGGAARVASLEAPAKVNLVLHVLGRRADGFHEIETVFQMLELSDDVRVTLDPTESRSATLAVHGPELGPERDNLAVRAAVAFLDAFSIDAAVRIELAKRIPAGGGLGGGSSDGAAVLRLLATLVWGEEPPAGTAERLHEIGARLGSDVPFFLGRGSRARGRGRGEILVGLPALPARPVVVALPPVHVSTGAAYRALQRGPRAEPSEPTEPSAPGDDGSGDENARDDGFAGWAAVEAGAHNDFESVVASAHPEIRASLDGLRRKGASTALLSGSGSASFGLFSSAEEAERVAGDLSAELGWACLATATRTAVPAAVPG